MRNSNRCAVEERNSSVRNSLPVQSEGNSAFSSFSGQENSCCESVNVTRRISAPIAPVAKLTNTQNINRRVFIVSTFAFQLTALIQFQFIHGNGCKPSLRTTHFPSFGKPGALFVLPSQPAAIIATAER